MVEKEREQKEERKKEKKERKRTRRGALGLAAVGLFIIYSLPVLANENAFDIFADIENVSVGALLEAMPDMGHDLVIDFEYALQRVNDRDIRLGTMENNRIILTRELRELNDAIRDADIRGISRSRYTMQEIEMLRSRRFMQNQLRSMDINEDMITLGNEMILKNTLANIETNRLDTLLLMAQIALKERNLAVAKLMYSLGLESSVELRNMENSLVRLQLNLESLKNVRDELLLNLNNMLGFLANDSVSVSYDFGASQSLPELQTQLDYNLINLPNIELLQMDLEYAQFRQHSYEFLLRNNERSQDYLYRGQRYKSSNSIELQDGVDTALQAITLQKENLELSMRTIHGNLVNLNENLRAQRLELQHALTDYEDVLVKYQAGLSAELELFSALLNVIVAELDVLRSQINYSNLLFNFDNPHIS